jgi:E3 ubiquitin-protein ligase RGLG
MGKSLEPFSTSGVIPAYGFGDLYTSDWSVFSLKADSHCRTFAEVLQVYNEITPNVTLSGPTNFAPLIYQAIEICQKLGDVSDFVKHVNNNTF